MIMKMKSFNAIQANVRAIYKTFPADALEKINEWAEKHTEMLGECDETPDDQRDNLDVLIAHLMKKRDELNEEVIEFHKSL